MVSASRYTAQGDERKLQDADATAAQSTLVNTMRSATTQDMFTIRRAQAGDATHLYGTSSVAVHPVYREHPW